VNFDQVTTIWLDVCEPATLLALAVEHNVKIRFDPNTTGRWPMCQLIGTRRNVAAAIKYGWDETLEDINEWLES
jgi:hypothetical protein